MRRSKRILLLLALAACATGAWFVPPQIRFLRVACGHAAKAACSAIFVAGRDLASVRAEELERFGILDIEVDRDAKTVTASAFGIASATARFRPGLGATLIHDASRPLSPPRIDPPAVPADFVDFASHPLTALDPVLDEAFAEPDPAHPRRTRAVLVVRDGTILAERYAPGFGPDTPQLGWSMSKTVLVSLLAILANDGKLDLRSPAPLASFREAHDGRATITVDQLLRMESGLSFRETYDDPDSDVLRMLFGADDMGDFAARRDIAAPPDTVRRYSSGTSLILSRMLREIVGDEAVTNFARDRLFAPLGMRTALVEFDPSGTPVGSSYVWASARDWARLGTLWLHDGVLRGQRVFPEGFVHYATTPTPHGHGRFGAHVWLNRPDGDAPVDPVDGARRWPHVPDDAFWAAGFDGQYTVVVPSADAVIVRLGQTPGRDAFDMDAMVGAILRVLVPR
ncbi:MAG: serine hydrolase [Planctomycetota bacterium]